MNWAGTDGNAWAHEIQRRIFCVMLGIASVVLAVIVARWLLQGRCPWADACALVAFAGFLVVARRHPERIRTLMWPAFGVILLDVIDGLVPWGPRVLTATHIFLPTLVLYGAVLGEMNLSLATAAVVFAIYGLTWYVHRPLLPEDAEQLGNLALSTVGCGMLAYAVWIQGRELVAALQRRAADLQDQLDANQRLTAVLSHDIANPLTGLQGTMELAHETGTLAGEDLAVAERMAQRMTTIIASVQQLNHDAGCLLPLLPVTVQELWNDLDEVFKRRLAAKRQRFVLSSGNDLLVNTDAKMLCASVLGNLLTNACKFSPGGAVIEMSARRAGDRVRVSMRNPGAGFSAKALGRVAAGLTAESSPGTEGERGDGHGLRIARFYLQRLCGEMEVANEAAGAVVTVILPSAP